MFEKEYAANPSYWGDEPEAIVRDYASRLHNDTVLDIGAGDGRNTLYLASLGFHVSALDISKQGLRNLTAKAVERNLEGSVDTIHESIVDFKPSTKYDNIITNFTLHFVGSDGINPYLRKMAKLTHAGGLNIISDFTQDGPLAETAPENYITQDRLHQFYQERNWEILHSMVDPVKTKRLDADGEPLEHDAVTFVARKPRS